jgi:RNA polymerase sigma-70 factor, ECF subfamily
MGNYIKKNSSDIFQNYWNKAYPVLAGYIRNFIFNQQDFSDILQDVTLIALKKFDSFDHERNFQSWIVGIAKYEILSRRKKYAKNPIIYKEEIFEKVTERYLELIPELEERMAALKNCLSKLSKKDRKMLLNKYSKKKKINELADEIGIQHSTLRVKFYRLRNFLKVCVTSRLNSTS